MTTINRLDWSDQRVNGPLPAGTVTLLLADVQGSTRLWQDHPDAMKDALARHDEILRDAINAHDGHVVKTTGDGVHAAFTDPLDALACTRQSVDAPLPHRSPGPGRTRPLSFRLERSSAPSLSRRRDRVPGRQHPTA